MKTGLRYVPYQERHPLVQWAWRQGVTIEEVAHHLKVSRVAIHHWDAGRFRPSGRVLTKIIDYTGGAVSPTDCHEYWMHKQAEKVA